MDSSKEKLPSWKFFLFFRIFIVVTAYFIVGAILRLFSSRCAAMYSLPWGIFVISYSAMHEVVWRYKRDWSLPLAIVSSVAGCVLWYLL